MKKFFENFKMRFSYVLFMGIIGVILQGIGFFMWNNADVKGTVLRTAKMKVFNSYFMSSYICIASAVFMILMAVGFIVYAKKNQLWTKISAYVLGGSQLLMIISSIVFMAVLVNCKKYMFAGTVMNSGYKGVYVFEKAMLLVKNICIVVSSGAFVSLSLSLMKVNKTRTFSKLGTYVSIATNGLFVISMLVVAFSSIGLNSYHFIARLMDGDISQSFTGLKDFSSTFLNPNGFTLGQLNKAILITDQISTSVDPSIYKSLNVSAIIGIVTISSYLISMLGNLISLAASTIDSYDLSRDDDRLAI